MHQPALPAPGQLDLRSVAGFVRSSHRAKGALLVGCLALFTALAVAGCAGTQRSGEAERHLRSPELPIIEEDVPWLSGVLQQQMHLEQARQQVTNHARQLGLHEVEDDAHCVRDEDWCLLHYTEQHHLRPTRHHLVVIAGRDADPLFDGAVYRQLMGAMVELTSTRQVPFAHYVGHRETPEALRPLVGEDRWARLNTTLQVRAAAAGDDSSNLSATMTARGVLQDFGLDTDPATIDGLLNAAARERLQSEEHPALAAALTRNVTAALRNACPELQREDADESDVLDASWTTDSGLRFRPGNYVRQRFRGDALPPLAELIRLANDC